MFVTATFTGADGGDMEFDHLPARHALVPGSMQNGVEVDDMAFSPQRSCMLAALLTCALAPGAAMAQWGDAWYLSVSGLYLLPGESSLALDGDQGPTINGDLELDSGLGFSIAMGAGDDVGLRGELELGYRKADWDEIDFDVEREDLLSGDIEGDFATFSVMANGVYAVEASDRMRPYFGIGLGLARHTADGIGEDDSTHDTVFAWQGMLGVGFPLSENTEARVGYRYFVTADGDFDGDEASYDSHSMEGGISVRF